jgi:uncharacterized protein YecE (DUF72 family)
VKKPRDIPPRIGCAGWSIGSEHRDGFDEGDSMLARYASRFNAVEINSSFYRPHMLKTYQRWAATVPAEFRFSAKLPKTISHELRLQNASFLLDGFLAEVSGLGEKLGGLLIQLPPSLDFDEDIASSFFSMLRERTPVALACEARHATWFSDRAQEVLQNHHVSRVAADPALIPDSNHVGGKGAWRYWRWHGSPEMYYSKYSDKALALLSEAIRKELPENTEPWIIFDNTANGHAIPNAMTLQAMLDSNKPAIKQAS